MQTARQHDPHSGARNAHDNRMCAASAASLHERLAAAAGAARARPDATTDAEGDALARQRLAAWQHLAANDDAAAFARRLAWDGIAVADLDAALAGAPRDGSTDPTQPWARLVPEILRAARRQRLARHVPSAVRAALTAGDPIPFEELLLPATSVGWEHLQARLANDPEMARGMALLAPAARAQLVRQLLGSLSTVSAPTWLAELDLVRPAGARLLLTLLPDATPPGTRTVYDAFVRTLHAGGLTRCFAERPALARVLAEVVLGWVDASSSFLTHLAQDWTDVAQCFGADPCAHEPPVQALQVNLSDRHNGGRSVLGLRLACGTCIAYKPRPVAGEAAFNAFLRWTARKGHALGVPAVRTLAVLARPGHGWVEWVVPEEVADADAGRRFFRRAGVLLGAVHLLWGTDCHRENLIAAGEHPVLIDAETLCHHEPAPEIFGVPSSSATSIDRHFRDSVLRTGLLPRWDMLGGRAIDVSGLGGSTADEVEREDAWLAINTDFMCIGTRRAETATQPHRARLAGQVLRAEDHADELLAGFDAFYRFAMRERARLLAADGPLAPFRGLPTRFVLRPTDVYHMLTLTSLTPARMRDGIERSLAFEPLCRALVSAGTRPRAWSLLRAEIAALSRLDVPYFHGDSASTALRGEGVEVQGFFAEPSFDAVLRRVRDLDEDDLALQRALVRGALDARQATAPMQQDVGATRRAVDASTCVDAPVHVPVRTPAALQDAALAIARNLAARALRASDGGANWIGVGRHPATERFLLQPLGADLYGGAPGVALFLAAAARHAPGEGFGDLARAALKPLRDALHVNDGQVLARWVRELGIGGGTGLGSVIYALTRIAGLLGDEALLDDARSAARLLTPALVRTDTKLDVLAGSAGALLGLLALHDATADASVLERAHACAGHLVGQQRPTRCGNAAWLTIGGEPSTGFAHGAAGIAYALARYDAVVPDARARAAAARAMAFERADCLPAISAGTDNDGTRHPWHMLNWCHGATGIGLARLGTLRLSQPVGDVAANHRDVDAALAAVERWGVQEIDHGCCGNAGRGEFLLEAATQLHRPALLEEARRRATWMLARADALGGFSLFPNLPGRVFSPGFFQGVAGIGYHLLRLAGAPLPSVLLLE